MYIWVGINVDEQLSDIKEKAQRIDKVIAFKNSCFSLPLHISLKISFEINECVFEEIISTISDYYLSITPFEVNVKGLEKDNIIVWIRMKKNRQLDKIHDDLNELLMRKYNIGLHEYDLDYKFHTTLFMDDDIHKIDEAFKQIKNEKLPSKLYINKFLIGTSPSGELGTFSVYKEIVKA